MSAGQGGSVRELVSSAGFPVDARFSPDGTKIAVVRGDDLLPSTARQILLHEALDLAPLPAYTHLPLVVGEDGRRLAKRHGDTRLQKYRDDGVRPERIVGLLASWCGVAGARREMTALEFADAFALDRMPRSHQVFSAEDESWLLSGRCN